MVAVAQKYDCYRSRLHEEEQVGFTIYEVPPGISRVTPQYVSEQLPLDYAPLQSVREVATFFALPPGDFVVMPNSVQHREGKFLLRILADQHADVWEINEDNLVVHSISTEFNDERTMDCVSGAIPAAVACIHSTFESFPTATASVQTPLAVSARDRRRPVAADHPEFVLRLFEVAARMADHRRPFAGLVSIAAGAARP